MTELRLRDLPAGGERPVRRAPGGARDLPRPGAGPRARGLLRRGRLGFKSDGGSGR